MDRDVRAALSLAQARARALGAATLDLVHVAWALEHPGDRTVEDSTQPEAPVSERPRESPQMLPFSTELEQLFSGPVERTVTMRELERSARGR